MRPEGVRSTVDGRCIGWRGTRMWYVDPESYRAIRNNFAHWDDLAAPEGERGPLHGLVAAEVAHL